MIVRKLCLFVAFVCLCDAGLGRAAYSQPFGKGNVLVSVGIRLNGVGSHPNTLFEFTRYGGLVRSLPISKPAGVDDYPRSVAVDDNGRLNVFNGTLNPFKSTLNPSNGTWTSTFFSGWSTQDQVGYGGIATYQSYVYVTDMATSGAGSPNGIVRFNTADQSVQRFATGTDYINLSVGWDGLLYAIQLGSTKTTVSVFDPVSMALQRTIDLPLDTYSGKPLTSIGVDKSGDLFLIGSGGTIYHFNSQGAQVASAYLGVHSTVNLALASDGRLAVGREDGYVTLTDESLSTFQSFQAYSNPNASAWTVYVAFAPGPLPATTNSDFNFDGKPDILFQNQATGDIAGWLMNGTSYLSGFGIFQGLDRNWKVVGMADFNRDGRPDILLQNQVTGDIACWLMDGTVYNGNGVMIFRGLDPAWKVVATGDFNQDEKPDILLQNSSTGAIACWFMNGTVYSSGTIVTTGLDTDWKVVGATDLNGDGKPDILFQNQRNGAIACWLMNGTSYQSGQIIYSGLDVSWKVVGTADYNGDGKADLLLQNQSTGDIAVWLMNGTAYSSGQFIYRGLDTNWKVVGPK